MVFAGLSLVVAASLATRSTTPASTPARAYFVTPTRVWELGVGGLLAVLLSSRAMGRRRASDAIGLPPVLRGLLAWAGVAVIAWTVLTYTGSTTFPGWQAGVPVLGAAAVIAACAPMSGASPGPAVRGAAGAVAGRHLLLALPMALADHRGPAVRERRPPRWLDKSAIIIVSLVLAALTKHFVEDRFRAAAWGRPLYKPFLLAALAMIMVVGGAQVQTTEVHHRQSTAIAKADQLVSGGSACVGAAAAHAGAAACPMTTKAPVVPSPVEAADDKGDAYTVADGHDCLASESNFALVTCTRGDLSSTIDVALVGNSHAAQFLPTLEVIAASSTGRSPRSSPRSVPTATSPST